MGLVSHGAGTATTAGTQDVDLTASEIGWSTMNVVPTLAHLLGADTPDTEPGLDALQALLTS